MFGGETDDDTAFEKGLVAWSHRALDMSYIVFVSKNEEGNTNGFRPPKSPLQRPVCGLLWSSPDPTLGNGSRSAPSLRMGWEFGGDAICVSAGTCHVARTLSWGVTSTRGGVSTRQTTACPSHCIFFP